MATIKDLLSNMISKIHTKVDKVDGMGLSTNDYTTEEKEKLASLSIDGLATEEYVDAQIEDVISQIPDVTNVVEIGNIIDKSHHYVTTDGYGKIIWEDKLAYEESGLVSLGHYNYLADDIGDIDEGIRCYRIIMNISNNLKPGDTMNIVFNGVEYECVLEYYTFNDGYDMERTYLGCGDKGVVDYNAENTGEKFYLQVRDNNRIFIYVSYMMTGEINISLHTYGIRIKTIDEKFLPESIATKEYVDEKTSNLDFVNMEFITVGDIDEICGRSILTSNEVKF